MKYLVYLVICISILFCISYTVSGENLPYRIYGNIVNDTYSDGTLIKVSGDGVVYDWFNPVETRNNTFGYLESFGDPLYIQGSISENQSLFVYIGEDRADVNINGIWYESISYKSGLVDNVTLRVHKNITVVTTVQTTLQTYTPTVTRTSRPTTVKTYPQSYVVAGGGGGLPVERSNSSVKYNESKPVMYSNETTNIENISILQTIKQDVVEASTYINESINSTVVEDIENPKNTWMYIIFIGIVVFIVLFVYMWEKNKNEDDLLR